jgi:hypothetical protein
MKIHHDTRSRVLLPLVLFANAGVILSLALLAAPSLAEEAEASAAIGRVVSVRGAAYAQSPGEERRVLQCRGPLYPGDEVRTLDGSDVGIDAGSYYVRLGENTAVEIDALGSGAPRLDLEAGHLRLMDSEGGASASAELVTPGLRLARTGSDQDAMVFAEKAGSVSMVCSQGGALNVARLGDPAALLQATPGACVVAKPREPLYVAEATHPQLAVQMRDACQDLAGTPVADRFSPDDVSLGPASTSGGMSSTPDPAALGGVAQPCSGACARGGVGVAPTQFPFNPPVLPGTP